MSSAQFAGAALAAAGALTLMGIITAEALYPVAYTTTGNEISDLGSSPAPGIDTYQPSGAVFDLAMVASGILLVTAALLLRRGGWGRWLVLLVALNGLGTLGVGIFPSSTGGVHSTAAALTFTAGSVAGIAAALAVTGPARWASASLGTIGLLALANAGVFGLDGGAFGGLGAGGAERWIAYSVVLWQVMFGGALMTDVTPDLSSSDRTGATHE